MKKQIKDFLAGAGEHHVAMARAHKTAADGYEADGFEADTHELVFHKAAQDSHTTMADACLAACKVLQNADLSDFGKSFMRDERDELVPTEVSIIAPTPPTYARTTRAIPRAGQPPISERPNVAEGFEKLFSVDEN